MQHVIHMIFLLLVAQSQAQFVFYNEHYTEGKFTFELIADAGAMNCLTDLGGNKGTGKPFIKDLNIGQTQASYGFSAAINYKRLISLRLQLANGKVRADDKLIRNAGTAAIGRYTRNLDFFSRIGEGSAMIEFFPVMLMTKEGNWLPRADWYLFAGLGYFHFNPTTRIEQDEIELWPLRTEGQGFREFPGRIQYKLDQFNIPFGTGVRIEMLPLVQGRPCRSIVRPTHEPRFHTGEKRK